MPDAERHSPTGPEPDLGGLGATRALRGTLTGVFFFVAPGSLVTGLLYYFGWVRDTELFAHLGLHPSLVSFSTQDYVLDSISSMYWTLAIGLLLALAALSVHAAIVSWADAPPGWQGTTGGDRRHRVRVLRRIVAGLGALAVVALAFGVVGFNRRTRFFSLASPLGVTFAIVFLGYAVHLYHRFLHRAEGMRPAPELKAVRLLSASLVTILLFLSLFLAVEHYARIRGIDLAVKVQNNPQALPSVTLYSAKRIELQPPVTETRLNDDNGTFGFKYTGLRLLFRSEHKYFLRLSDAPSYLNIVISEGPDVRLEFEGG